MVAAYPYWPNQHVLEDVAVRRGEPSLGEIIGQTWVPQGIVTWEDVKSYADRLDEQNVLTYVPFVSGSRARLLLKQ